MSYYSRLHLTFVHHLKYILFREETSFVLWTQYFELQIKIDWNKTATGRVLREKQLDD